MEKITTAVNPGAFQHRRKISLRSFLGRIFRMIRQRQWKALRNFAPAEGLNLLYESGLLKSRKRFECPICGYEGSYFVSKSNELRIAWHSYCPQCNSRTRHRGLKFLYDELLASAAATRLLHFAPEPVLMRVIRQYPAIEYKTTDYLLQDVDYPGEDIQALSFADNSFDLVFCNHVIEHVPDDRKALQEIQRILRPGGKAVITIPGVWSRKETIPFPDLRHNGHYRDYGMDVVQVMQAVFSKVAVKNLHDYNRNTANGTSHGIPAMEPAFICTK